MQACPSCGRPVAAARPTCVYCGAGLPEAVDAGPSATPAAPEPTAEGRLLLVLDLRRADPRALERGLGLAPYEAAQRARRGGLQLHRVLAAAEAGQERSRLLEAGLEVHVVPEAEGRAALEPLLALGGGFLEGRFRLRTEEGEAHLGAGDLLLIVEGPITRQHQVAAETKRLRSASLAEGYRFHLHRRADPRPVELDPGSFDFGGRRASPSSLLEIKGWTQSLTPGVALDDGFRREAPVLGPAAPGRGVTGVAESMGPGGDSREGRPVILDNLAQFRFYSGWRGALARLGRG